MDVGLAQAAISEATFPWLSLIVLLPAAGALFMPLLPGDDDQPSPWPRNLALVVLLVDLLLMLVVFATRFDPSIDSLQLVERVSWLPVIELDTVRCRTVWSTRCLTCLTWLNTPRQQDPE